MREVLNGIKIGIIAAVVFVVTLFCLRLLHIPDGSRGTDEQKIDADTLDKIIDRQFQQSLMVV